jgi:glycosyltransferase involved in cell wall biosynthesis
MESSLVSIIVPTKNSAGTLEKCLKSLVTQTYGNLEIIVVDNSSTDSTQEIAARYTRNVYTKGPERSYQRNFAVEKATGEFICIIDSDMNLEPEVIEQCVDLMTADKKTVGVTVPEESFGDGFWAQCKKLERSFYVGVPYMEAARFFYRKDFLDIGGYDVEMVSGEDWDLSQRIESRGKLARTSAYIHHDEGHISLLKTIKKKLYYAKLFASYTANSGSQEKVGQQTNLFGRYKLFFSHPKKLFHNPILGLGMLFMKTCEFGFGGIGYLMAKVHAKHK